MTILQTNHRPCNRARPRRTFAALAIIAAVNGCASLDPAPEITRAASTVSDRTGITPAWTEAWESSLTMWDARTPLKIGTAVAMALRNNRELRARIEQIATARADLVQAGLLPNPVLALTLRFPFDPVSGGSFVGAQVVQSFTALWLRDGKVRAADARLNQTVLDVSDKALRLVAEVKATHTRIVFGQRTLALANENLVTIQLAIDSHEARVRGGEGTAIHVNRARQQLAKAQADHGIMLRDLATNRRRMLELIGFASENADWAAEPRGEFTDTGIPATDGARIEEDAVIALALSQRLDIAAARSIALAQQTDLTLEEQSRLKGLGLGVDFERDADGRKSIGPIIEIGIPIFDTNATQIAKAGSLARAALANYEAAAQRAVREARVAWIEWDSAMRQTEQYRASVLRTSERNVILEEDALRSGQGDRTSLVESRRELTDASRTLSDLERDAALALVGLEQAVGGRLLPAHGSEMLYAPGEVAR